MRFAPVAALLLVALPVLAACSKIEEEPTATATATGTATAEPTATEPTRPVVTSNDGGQTVCRGAIRPPQPGQERTFPALYTRQDEARGIAIVGVAAISDEAFAVARETIEELFANDELLQPLVDQGAYVIITAPGQNILELPEFECLAQEAVGGRVAHACGIADRADYPVVTVSELDLLGEITGPCAGLNILFHELGHLVQNWFLAPADYFEVRYLYQEALDEGLYAGDYAATNANEYWAEATQAYFLHSDLNGNRDRAWLETYDPALYEIVDRAYSP